MRIFCKAPILKIPDRKELSSSIPIERMPPTEELRISLKQGAGAPAIPVVEVGQRVRKGELIARADEEISCNVHASMGGTVKEITADTVPSVLLSVTDEETTYAPPMSAPTPQQIVTRVREAGISGMGGAGFPTCVKLQPPKKVDTLLINGAECEPYLTCDERIMLERTEEIVRGARYLASGLGAQNIAICIEQNKPACIEKFQRTDLAVVQLKKRYPMGAERQLIYFATNRRVPLHAFPYDVGTVVQNVATALAVCEAVEHGKPLIERVVTVSGEGIAQPKNLLVPIGTPLSALAKYAGNFSPQTVKIICGGPMTGSALKGLEHSVAKTTSGVLFLTKNEVNLEEATPCINCGKCAEVCPMRLMPMQAEFYSATKEYEKAEKYGGVLFCVECGACAYICPARRPLVQAIVTAKRALKTRR